MSKTDELLAEFEGTIVVADIHAAADKVGMHRKYATRIVRKTFERVGRGQYDTTKIIAQAVVAKKAKPAKAKTKAKVATEKAVKVEAVVAPKVTLDDFGLGDLA